MVEEISVACREQDIGTDQINSAMQQLDKVIQQNASSSEQMSATTEELSSQAEQLKSVISFFVVDGDDQGTSAFMAPKTARRPELARLPGKTKAWSAKPGQKPGKGKGFVLDMSDNNDDSRFDQY